MNNVTSSETYKKFVRYKKLFEQLLKNNHCKYSTNRDNDVYVYCQEHYGTCDKQNELIQEKGLGVITELLGEYGIKI